MKFVGLTEDFQEQYNLSRDFISTTCEYEEWDTPEKLCSLLFSATPLIGEACISDEQRTDFSKKGAALFNKLMTRGDSSLSLLEKRILAAAVVFHVQQMDEANDDDNDNQMWDYALSKLGYDEKKMSFSKQTACNSLKKIVYGSVRISTEHGKQYYNTIKMQALAPAASICELYEIIYNFYRNNLQCQYEECSNAFVILANNLQKKLNSSANNEHIKLGSSVWALKSSIKVLFLYYPEYMAAVCEAVTKKLDLLMRGDTPYFCECNRWDNLLKKWFDNKSAAEKTSMQQIRAKRISSRIATSKNNISPEYVLKDTELAISIPRMRLPEITRRPIIRIFQADTVVYESKLSGYGNEMCYTTNEFSAELSRLNTIDWSSPFHFLVQLLCGDEIVYDSGAALYRDYLVFNENGLESTITRCKNGTATIVANTSTSIEIIDPEDDYYDETIDFQQIRLSLFSAQLVLVNGTDILLPEEKEAPIRCCLSGSIKGVHGTYNAEDVLLFDKVPVLNVLMGKTESAKNYQLFRDNKQQSLHEYASDSGSFSIDLPSSSNFYHHIYIKDFQSGKIVYECSYFILPGFSYSFSKAFFLNEECSGYILYNQNGTKKRFNFELVENQNTINVPIWNGKLNCIFDVPKLNLNLCGENILYWPEHIWYEDILQDQFIKVSAPSAVKVSFFLGRQPVSKAKRGNYYELGNTVFAHSWEDALYTLGVIITDGCSRYERRITDVYFKPKFIASPIHREGKVLTWDPYRNYLGPDNPEFKVELENDRSDDPWIYSDLQPGKPFEKNFSCRPGSYTCKVFNVPKASNNPFSKKEDRALLWEEIISVEYRPEDRFVNKDIVLTKVHFWSYETKKEETAVLSRNVAVITNIDYTGLNDWGGELPYAVPAYCGTLMFQRPNGNWHYMNSTQDSKDFELINPVTFYLDQSRRAVIYNAKGEPLQLNAKKYTMTGRVWILNRKTDYSKDEQLKWLPIADGFEYREERRL